MIPVHVVRISHPKALRMLFHVEQLKHCLIMEKMENYWFILKTDTTKTQLLTTGY